MVLEIKCVVQRVCIQTAWVETKTVKEQEVTIRDLGKSELRNNKTAKARTVKYTYVVSARENCCEAGLRITRRDLQETKNRTALRVDFHCRVIFTCVRA